MKLRSVFVRPALALGLALGSLAASAAMDGVWRTEEGTLYRVAPCNDGWCAVYLGFGGQNSAREGCGMLLASGLRPEGENWLRGGKANSTDAKISIHAVSAEKLEILLFEKTEAQAERLSMRREVKHSGRCET
jgi:malonyl CoA-acyl carrier protein transacylase